MREKLYENGHNSQAPDSGYNKYTITKTHLEKISEDLMAFEPQEYTIKQLSSTEKLAYQSDIIEKFEKNLLFKYSLGSSEEEKEIKSRIEKVNSAMESYNPKVDDPEATRLYANAIEALLTSSKQQDGLSFRPEKFFRSKDGSEIKRNNLLQPRTMRDLEMDYKPLREQVAKFKEDREPKLISLNPSRSNSR